MLVYLITNKVNGKQYVGQTIHTLEARWKRHCWAVTANTSGMPISFAIAKYGKENFSLEVLGTATTQEELDTLEIECCAKFDTFSPKGYNLRAGKARGKCSEETKKRISEGNKGRLVSAETKIRLRASHLGNQMPDSTRAKLQELYAGRSVSTLGPKAFAEKKSQTYTVTSPDGAVAIVKNMKQFCLEHDLSPAKMCLVAQGKRTHHKGWGFCRGKGFNHLGKIIMKIRDELCL